MFRRRHTRRLAATAPPVPGPDRGVTAVVLEDADGVQRASSAEAWASLRRIVAEAVILQDDAEAVLLKLRDTRDLAEVAPTSGALISRFVALRERLPACVDPALARYTGVVRRILDHHVLMLDSSRALLAADWRSERIREQLDRIDGLGPPAQRLDAVRAEILALAEP